MRRIAQFVGKNQEVNFAICEKCAKIRECIECFGIKRMKMCEIINIDVGIGPVGRNPVANSKIGSVAISTFSHFSR